MKPGSKVEELLGRTKKGERIQTSLKVDKKLYEELQGICLDRGVTVSAVVDAMLEDVLGAARQTPKK